MPSFNLLVNGEHHRIDADADMPLLWALRDLLRLTGTKYGCGMGFVVLALSTKMVGRLAPARSPYRRRQQRPIPQSRVCRSVATVPAKPPGLKRTSRNAATARQA